MYIQLEQDDYNLIAEAIAEADNGCGREIEYSDLYLTVTFDKEVYEHRDTDYYNGTGAWITDSVDFTLGDITCGDVEIRYSHKKLEKTITDYLWNR